LENVDAGSAALALGAITTTVESTAGVRIERTFSLPITALCIAVAGIEPAVMPCSSMLSPLCADLPASLVRVTRNHVIYELADFYGAAPGCGGRY